MRVGDSSRASQIGVTHWDERFATNPVVAGRPGTRPGRPLLPRRCRTERARRYRKAAGRAKWRDVSAGQATEGDGGAVGLESLIGRARQALPGAHGALLEQIGVQDAVIDSWPAGVQGLYETVGESPPSLAAIADAVAVWLPDRRVVAYNGPLLLLALSGINDSTRQAVINNIAWHEYGHALSVTRATDEMRQDGVRLLGLRPDGLRAAIDYPGTYRIRQVFDEVVANVYAMMVGRAVHQDDYSVPGFLDEAVYDAFIAVVPWPPDGK